MLFRLQVPSEARQESKQEAANTSVTEDTGAIVPVGTASEGLGESVTQQSQAQTCKMPLEAPRNAEDQGWCFHTWEPGLLGGKAKGQCTEWWDGWNQGWAGAGARPAGVGSFSRALGCLFSP